MSFDASDKDVLKRLIHSAPRRQLDVALLILASFGSPAAIKDVNARAIEVGVRKAKKWNLSDMFRRAAHLVIKLPSGWELTEAGRAQVRELGYEAAHADIAETQTPTVDRTRKAVILTALPVEHAAVMPYIARASRQRDRGTIYDVGEFVANDVTWTVAIAEIGAGNVRAASETERAINVFKPDVVLFVGVAGGIKDLSIGDVVVAEKIYNYESAKLDPEVKTRPHVFRSSYALVQSARAVIRDAKWQTRSPRGSSRHAVVGAVAAGEKLLASSYSSVAELIRNSYNDAVAVEMEGGGVLEAAHANEGTRAVVIRGISDLLDGKSASDKSGSQTLASENAAAFAFELLAQTA